MTALEQAALIGRYGTMRSALAFRVIVTDVRQSFGRTDLQLKPVVGEGSAWISSENVKLDNVERI